MSELNGRRLVAADLIAGLAFVVIGAGALVAAAAMPTYVDRGADPLTAPGIFPAFVSAAIILLGGMLVVRSLRGRAAPAATEDESPLDLRPFGIGLVLMTVAIMAIGKLPFGIVMAGSCLAHFAALVNWRGTRADTVRRLVAAAITIIITALLIPLAFEHIFLVRLP